MGQARRNPCVSEQKRKLQARTFLFLAGALSAFPSIKLECYFSH